MNNSFWWAVLASLAWGSSGFIEKIGLHHAQPLPGVVARGIGVMVGVGLLALTSSTASGQLTSMGWRSFFSLAGGGILASVVGQIFFYRALKDGEVGRVAAVGGSWPIFAFFLSTLFLGEPVDLRRVTGVLCVIAGVILLR